MALDNGFWEDDIFATLEKGGEARNPARKKQQAVIDEEALNAPPRQLATSAIDLDLTVKQMAAATAEAFPGAGIRPLPGRSNIGLLVQVGTNNITMKVVPDDQGRPRYRTFLMEGAVLVNAGNPMHTASQIGSGDHGSLNGYIAWLSWAHRQIAKVEIGKLKLCLTSTNCLPSTMLGQACRCVHNLMVAGLTVPDIIEDLRMPLPWTFKGTQGACNIYRLFDGAGSNQAGAIAFDLRDGQWKIGMRLSVKGLNPIITEEQIGQRTEVPSHAVPAELDLARVQVSQAADALYATTLFLFLQKYAPLRGMRELGLDT